jgi:3-oxoacyl-[acyl-carrier-protein] synthase-3
MTATIGSRISGTGHYVPARVMTNFDLEKLVDTSDAWIQERTGIRERRIAAEGETTSDMATAAARRALESAELDPSDVDMIIVNTVTPDMPLPATAMFVQQKLGTKNHCPSFDLAAACAGFIYGLSIADQFVRTGYCKNVVVIGVELLSRVLDWKDRTTCVLFGDGAGAVLLEPSSDDTGILDIANEVEGSGGSYLYMPGGGSLHPPTHETVDKKMHYIRQEGQHVFKYAVRKFADSSAAILERNGIPFADLDLLVPHQANVRIIDAARDRLGLPDEKVVKNIARYGNTTAATIPLALGTALDEGRLRRGQLVLLAAVGAGFTVGTALVRWTGFPWK